ncbi:putative RRM-like domain containing protein [Leishmania shawi]|uniref:RRM-like domain containing protein n=1 Tax=Leishmania shawi TaxID=5680 RepID=A0AAW3BG01_9TRYP
MRGRGGRGGRGGSFGGFTQQPTNTISIRVSEIQQPVTEDVMRRVFQSVGVSCNSIQITPTNNPQETSVVAHFPDNFAAERVMSSLNNRNIFNNGNKMSMQYTTWLTSGSPAPMNSNNGGVLQSSAFENGNAFAAQQMPQLPQMPQMPQHPQMPQMPQHPQMPQMPQHPQMPQMPQVPQVPQVPQMPQVPHHSQMPQVPQQPQISMPTQPIPQPQPMPMSVFTNPVSGMMQPQQMDAWYGANPAMDMMSVTVGFPGAARGTAMMRGNRARGRGGRGGYGFDPMALQPGYMPFAQRGGMIRGGPAMMPRMNYVQYQPFGQPPTVFVSVTLVPVTEPLQPIFTLMESFGGVTAIRRNQNKKEILTVKAASPDDALAIVTYMHRVPYVGGQVSGKLFPNYVERYPCTDEGDPLDPETVQYDFTASRHRSPGHRSKAVPSRIIKITGCNTYEDTEVMTYLNGKGINPERITKSEDGTFEVHLPDVATSVKVLLECQGSVCDEEKSNVIFVEGPRDDPVSTDHKVAEEHANEQ